MTVSPTLTLTRTVLRPFTDSDADILFALHRDADVARVVPFRPHANLDDARQLLTRWRGADDA
jgi:RimJ/RimL family protein N-acetyltransferase